MGRIVAFFRKDLINGWRTDLEPPDNRLGIDLESGAYFRPRSQFQSPLRFFSGTVSGSGSAISTNTR